MEYGLLGLVAGFLAGYLGIGGGLVLVPVLAWIFTRDASTSGIAMHLAVATSLATMLVTSLGSIWSHHRHQAVLWPLVRRMTPGLVLGAATGAWLASMLNTDQLGGIFGGFALAAGLQMLLSRTPETQKPLPSGTLTSAVAVAIGSISSIVGIGGGSMTAPWLMWHGVRAQNAVATAAACGYPIALAGTLGFVLLGREATGNSNATLGYVYLPALAGIVLFSLIAAPIGAAAVHKTPPRFVKKIFGLFLLLLAAKMIWQAYSV